MTSPSDATWSLKEHIIILAIPLLQDGFKDTATQTI